MVVVHKDSLLVQGDRQRGSFITASFCSYYGVFESFDGSCYPWGVYFQVFGGYG